MSERKAAIWVSKRRMGGEPCLYGSRIPMSQLDAIEAEHSMGEIMLTWPYLDRSHVEHALELYREIGSPTNPNAHFGRALEDV